LNGSEIRELRERINEARRAEISQKIPVFSIVKQSRQTGRKKRVRSEASRAYVRQWHVNRLAEKREQEGLVVIDEKSVECLHCGRKSHKFTARCFRHEKDCQSYVEGGRWIGHKA
jgi:hypothetical protein